MKLSWHTTQVDQTTSRLTASEGGERVTWRRLVDGWLQSEGTELGERLAGHPAAACFWECPPLTRSALDEPFECVLVNAPTLATIDADDRTFARYFDPGSAACSFSNLGGDATLVAPTPGAGVDCSHLLAYCRTAPPDAQAELWRKVAAVLQEQLDDEPCWLSTSGLGVAWLHVRLDHSPKYYQHQPYRRFGG